jgi:hypothetical protein
MWRAQKRIKAGYGTCEENYTHLEQPHSSQHSYEVTQNTSNNDDDLYNKTKYLRKQQKPNNKKPKTTTTTSSTTSDIAIDTTTLNVYKGTVTYKLSSLLDFLVNRVTRTHDTNEQMIGYTFITYENFEPITFYYPRNLDLARLFSKARFLQN